MAIDPHRLPWPRNRLFPLLATISLVVVGMVTTTWGSALLGAHEWALPHDLWRTLVAGDRLRHLDFANLYTKPTALVTFPGAALILVPGVVVIDALGLGLGFQTAQNPYPAAWLVAGPYEIALSAVVLFAADAIAERLGAGRRNRALLATAGAVALWNVSVRFGHPEDAVAVALFLYGLLALAGSRWARCAWLIGVAVAVQPLVLLGLPMVLVVLSPKWIPGFLIRAAAPAVVVLGIAAVANWNATLRAVTTQPNFPSRNHPTPWTALAPDLGAGAVSAGPGRLLAVLLAGGCALVVGSRWRRRQPPGRWSPPILEELLWWVALAFSFRCVFESVMVAYYVWPVLAVALVAAAGEQSRLVAVSAATTVVTFLTQATWRGAWMWWAGVVLGLGVVLFLARPRSSRREESPGALDTGPPAAGLLSPDIAVRLRRTPDERAQPRPVGADDGRRLLP